MPRAKKENEAEIKEVEEGESTSSVHSKVNSDLQETMDRRAGVYKKK